MTSQTNLDPERFVQAQNEVMHAVRHELASGRKRTHWMWFVFPQLAGLGQSPTAKHFALQSLAEADAYLRHPVLGGRLVECTMLVLDIEGRTIADIFSLPDDVKFHSCMTLFSQVPGAATAFNDALTKYFSGKPDDATLRLLGR